MPCEAFRRVLVRLLKMEPIVRTQKSIQFLLITTLWLVNFSPAQAAIQNDPKKEYRLTEKHGPWMIMVATFSNVDEAKRKTEGLTAEEAARKLVHELRSAGYPAYVYSQEDKKETIETYDRLGNKDKGVFRAQFGMVCVLAGNYKKIDDPVAQATLTQMKKFRPKFLADPKSGAILRDANGGKQGPFFGAFLTINPMLNPADVVRHKVDDTTRVLNSGIDYPLVNLKHKYSLKIATFTGKSAIPLGSSRFSGKESNFDKVIQEQSSYGLARAGEDATQLTYALRQNNGVARTLGRDRFEAYVYHDRFQSYVSVGGFDSPNDPEIRQLAEIFMGKYELEEGEYKLKCKSLFLPNQDPNSLPIQTWAFDPVPEIIEVPRIK